METRQDRLTEAQLFEQCTNSEIQEKVFKYLLDDIEDEQEAEAAEDHLLGCQYCRETFLTMLSVRGEAKGAENLCERRDESAPADVPLIKLAAPNEQGVEEKRPALRARSARGQSK